jgi:hypothetical protein
LIVRLVGLDQPIVENYVGRQIPTAMVARNLEKGSGFLHPELDTGPFPNRFLVEPPIFAECVVLLLKLTRLEIGEAGRLLSALASTLAVWGLYGLINRREGTPTALIAAIAWCAFPITIRYGRACQPDMLMLGTLLAGLNLWDLSQSGRNLSAKISGILLLSLGLALKVIAAPILIPALEVARARMRRWLLLATLLPAIAWYLYAANQLKQSGSLASADNSSIWLNVLIPTALLRPETYTTVGRFLLLRSFTPFFLLACWGYSRPLVERRFWDRWGLATTLALLILAAKLHHEYYFLLISPFVALGLSKSILTIATRWGRGLAVLVSLSFLGLGVFQAIPTWRTPTEWASITVAGQLIHEHVPPDELVIATEALLYMADRRGCRLEMGKNSTRRAAGEWGKRDLADRPEALVEFYLTQGAHYFADLKAMPLSKESLELHNWVRRRGRIVVDHSGLLLVKLSPGSRGGDHAEPSNTRHLSRFPALEVGRQED